MASRRLMGIALFSSLATLGLAGFAGCSSDDSGTGSVSEDGGADVVTRADAARDGQSPAIDASPDDAAPPGDDGAVPDAEAPRDGGPAPDAGPVLDAAADSGPAPVPDAGVDAGPVPLPDAGVDAGPAPTPDAGDLVDAGTDAGCVLPTCPVDPTRPCDDYVATCGGCVLVPQGSGVHPSDGTYCSAGATCQSGSCAVTTADAGAGGLCNGETCASGEVCTAAFSIDTTPACCRIVPEGCDQQVNCLQGTCQFNAATGDQACCQP